MDHAKHLICPECRIPSKIARGGVESFQTNIAIQRIVGQLSGIQIVDQKQQVCDAKESTSSLRFRVNYYFF